MCYRLSYQKWIADIDKPVQNGKNGYNILMAITAFLKQP